MLEAIERSHGRVFVAMAFVAVGCSALLLMAAKAAQHEARIMERLRPVCDHSGFTRIELTRLVRSETRPFTNKDDAVRSLTAMCQARRHS